MLDSHKVGDTMTVHFNLSSREYNGKYYHNIDAWKIETYHSNETEWKSTKETSDVPF